jgi:hypothetical protein
LCLPICVLSPVGLAKRKEILNMHVAAEILSLLIPACNFALAEVRRSSNGISRPSDGLPRLHRHSRHCRYNPAWYLLEIPQTRHHEEAAAAKKPWFR